MGERETHLHQGNSGQAGCEKRGKSALSRVFRTYAQSPYHCRAIQRATARGASPPRTPPSRHFRPSHQPHTALPSRHILQYVTGRILMGPQKHLFVWVVTICDNLLKFRFSQLESEVVRKVVYADFACTTSSSTQRGKTAALD